MNDITVNKSDLLKALQENRDRHIEIFNEALEGYKTRCIQELEARLEDIKKGRVIRVVVSLPMPENHTSDYDRVIKMVEMHTGNDFVLDEHDFGAYVMDDWAWRRAFLTSNSVYSAGATQMLESQ